MKLESEEKTPNNDPRRSSSLEDLSGGIQYANAHTGGREAHSAWGDLAAGAKVGILPVILQAAA